MAHREDHPEADAGPRRSRWVLAASTLCCLAALGGPATAGAVITFGAKTSINAGFNNTQTVVSADFDGDGDLDLAATQTPSNEVAVWLGNGGGAFNPATTFGAGSEAFGLVSGDFDRDGDADLAVSNNTAGSGTARVLTNDGSGSFAAGSAVTTGARSQHITAGDFDRDGDLDLATSNLNGGAGGGSVSVTLGAGDGTFAAATEYPLGSNKGPQGIAAGDFDRDGDLDLVTANNFSNEVAVLFGDGSGAFGSQLDIAVGAEPSGIAVGDFDRNGNPDIAVTERLADRVQILLGNGIGGFPGGSNYATDGRPTGVTAADLDRDGNLDLVTANNFINNPNNDSLSVLAGDGNGAFGAPNNLIADFAARSVVAGDFNRDGKPDLAATAPNSGTVTTHPNTTTTGFSTGISFALKVDTTTGAGTRGVATGDFDRDGRADVVSTGTTNDDISLLTGNGDGTLDAAVPFAMGTDPVDVATADFDRDGDLDVVTANSGAMNVTVRLGNGAGSFGSAVNYTLSGFPSGISVGDLNDDGDPDLVATNSAPAASVLLGNGDGTFGAADDTTVGSNPSLLAIGDLDTDGDLDVVTANRGGGNLSVLLGDGTGDLTTAVDYATAAAADSVTIGDHNRDGIPDLTAVNSASSGTLSVLTGVGDGTFNAASNSPFAGNPQQMAIDDLNRDGRLDVLAASENSANVATRAGTGSATFGSQLTFATGNFPRSLATADFNRDGRPDVVTGNNGPGNVSVLLNNSDNVAPATPTIDDTDPDSPANDLTPEVKGSGAEAGSTVKIYSGANCNGAVLNSGTATAFNTGGGGITVTVGSNVATQLRATATDAAGNVSDCSAPFAYTHDAAAPATPTITATVPTSPANDNDPVVKGTGAESGTTVKIYGDMNCTGTVLGSGTADDFNGVTGITATVPGDDVTDLRATATDGVNNISGCSGAFPYTEDSTGPTVTDVTSPKTNGSYTVGETISIQVTFSESVTVAGGTPQLTLETGTTDRVVDLTSGSGSSTLNFDYTVSAGDTAADLDYTATGALALNGSTIRDAATNNASLTLPTPGNAGSLGANKDLVIDTSAPTVTTSARRRPTARTRSASRSRSR